VRVLVTGGAGFIGSNFVRRLIEDHWAALATSELARAEIVVLDALATGGTLASLAPVAASPRLRIEVGDIRDPGLVTRLMTGTDLVVHFAAETHVDRSIADGAPFVSVNVAGTQVLLEAAVRAGVSKFVQVSTDEVYGSIRSGSWPETQPLDPSSPYSAAKAGADLLALAYHRTYGLPVCVTRAANNYGPYQFPEKLIPRFVTRLLDGRKVPLYGDGQQVRDWLHADDHGQAVALVAAGGRPGQIYNVGGGTELTNTELTRRILAAVGAGESMVEHVADRPGHDQRYSVDWTKLRDELGYRPRVPFDAGLAATITWYRENRAWWEPLG
jgi:dTDP-glucose 4,6-dehydratase